MTTTSWKIKDQNRASLIRRAQTTSRPGNSGSLNKIPTAMKLFTAEHICHAISNLVGFEYKVKFSHLSVASLARKKQSVAYTE